jgi:hypothetical protein
MDNHVKSGDMVFYKSLHRVLPAVVVMAYGDATADLVVFGTPKDGPEYASGARSLEGVHRGVRHEGGYPPAGTWFNS